ncbi:lipopolysaccharide export system protein LptC [Marinomonas polaris DSM 16579]|uniref:Lipopolysaccharide export system protein LptC n=1 Tax=Marinomonas polaris DSM 16579 TaxID=1122206 RepID=A0A1M5D262_9GAMM|nr:LPS export ABC transporter periplasmic protein LptC [Marinomonas polaris]SHF61068.1 lipopolysaccharide export system protein LptC [Marinomonas polaris DSM 16579]
MLSLKTLTKPKSLLIIGATLIVVASLGWYGAAPIQNLVQTDSLSSSPDYFITNVKVKEFDADGLLIETLDAEQTLHYIAKSTTLLQTPNVERYSKSGHWSAKADKGVIEDGSNDILLTENARATKKYLQSEDIKLSADNIHYLDKDQSLTSYGNATLISTQGETSAGTITTYINSEEVVMTGSVRGKYETIH